MMKNKVQILILCVLSVLWLCGCGAEITSKTIVLPEGSDEENKSAGIEIRDIQEYIWEIALWHNPEEEDIRQADISPDGEHVSYRLTYHRHTERYEELFMADALEDGERQITEQKVRWQIRAYSDDEERLRWAWSGNGEKLVVWGALPGMFARDGLRVYDMDLKYNDGIYCIDELSFEKKNLYDRKLFPNQDASMIYVVEEVDRQEVESAFGYEVSDTYYWHYILDMNADQCFKMGYKTADEIQPIQCTDEGLLAKNGEGVVSIYRDIYNLSEKEDLFQLAAADAQVCMCSNGDHIFVLETDANGAQIVLRGIRIEDGEVQGQQILYKGSVSGDAKAVIGPGDDSILIWSSETLEDNQCLVRITELKY